MLLYVFVLLLLIWGDLWAAREVRSEIRRFF